MKDVVADYVVEVVGTGVVEAVVVVVVGVDGVANVVVAAIVVGCEALIAG